MRRFAITSRHESCFWSQDGWYQKEGVAKLLPPNRRSPEAVSLPLEPLGEEGPYVETLVSLARNLLQSLRPIFSAIRKPLNV